MYSPRRFYSEYFVSFDDVASSSDDEQSSCFPDDLPCSSGERAGAFLSVFVVQEALVADQLRNWGRRSLLGSTGLTGVS
ncbi:hypothetical protein M6B38_380550 [Iris pallida]|uniref:Uncharacterized protein n=1 Tax=Iris pallida TaxID=29817 RepID=A0AAX6G951_IRIPA|nr:hypothetical protein M6B38_380550 [Iris pallida]